jgi:hypothetical protein
VFGPEALLGIIVDSQSEVFWGFFLYLPGTIHSYSKTVPYTFHYHTILYCEVKEMLQKLLYLMLPLPCCTVFHRTVPNFSASFYTARHSNPFML